MKTFILTSMLAFLLVTGCGTASEPTSSPPASPDQAWATLIENAGLVADGELLDVRLARAGDELAVMLERSDAGPARLLFADALYGARAYTYGDGRWSRVDTAEARAELAPMLGRGERATFHLPVEQARSYRVLIPVAGKAIWGDLPTA